MAMVEEGASSGPGRAEQDLLDAALAVVRAFVNGGDRHQPAFFSPDMVPPGWEVIAVDARQEMIAEALIRVLHRAGCAESIFVGMVEMVPDSERAYEIPATLDAYETFWKKFGGLRYVVLTPRILFYETDEDFTVVMGETTTIHELLGSVEEVLESDVDALWRRFESETQRFAQNEWLDNVVRYRREAHARCRAMSRPAKQEEGQLWQLVSSLGILSGLLHRKREANLRSD
jgi:hypothetical protein